MSDITVKKAHFRSFLNTPTDDNTASVFARYKVFKSQKWRGGKKVDGAYDINMDCDFEVRSCYDAITLHFGIYRQADIAGRRRKLALLRDALDVIEQGLDAAEAAFEKKGEK